MTALLDTMPLEPLDEVALAEIALEDLLKRSERLHHSNIQHDPLRCLLCFEQR